jgi:curved DNA-binding protein CbpA
MDFTKNYYCVLEVDEKASSIEIKKAYRKLAKKYHPDLNPGNIEYEEATKAINEAYGVIGNQENKFIYDQYLSSKHKNSNLQKDPDPTVATSKNKRFFVKKSVVTTKKHLYVVGEIYIKYYALQDDLITNNLNDIYFKISPTSVSATIYQYNIYRDEEPPADVKSIFTNIPSSPFILENTATEVISVNRKDIYNLEIRNPIILNPAISDVSKHEGISYGTLTGTFYAILEFIEEHEIEETAYECFGESGRKETKSDEYNTYHRIEYYNSDCTTYWSQWVAKPITNPKPTTKSPSDTYKFTTQGFRKWYQSVTNFSSKSNPGCGFIFIILFFGFFLWMFLNILGPITWLLVLLALLLFLRNSGWFINTIFRVGSFVFALFCLAALWSIFTGTSDNIPSNTVNDNRESSTNKTESINNSGTTKLSSKKDQIISHFRVWKDYSGNQYEGEMKIFVSDYKSAQRDHHEMNIQIESEEDWPDVYKSMLTNDRNRISMLYALFDSIQNAKKLDRSQFAEMIVSCIQDIPYYIVLPNECDIQVQEDPFVRNFIDEKPGFCLGNISFGVQSPGEFLGNLKGDCDTRVAMLFAIFNHYKYKVAILGSTQFRHSVLGIELPVDGLTKNYNGINYKLWETTSEGFRPGALAAEVSDLNYWNFYLTN